MKKIKNIFLLLCILAVLLVLGRSYYRYTNYYYGQQFYKECRITTEKDSYTFAEGEPLTIPVTVRNNSRASLVQSSNYFLSYHLLDASGHEIDPNGIRTPLDLDPFRKKTVSMKFTVPKAGEYQLVLDAVRDGYYWHGDLGGETKTVSVTVNGTPTPEITP